MTSVEWLVEQLSNYDSKMVELFDKEINQAEEMEKQQSHNYAEFAIRCDRLGMKILNFDGYMNLENKATFNK